MQNMKQSMRNLILIGLIVPFVLIACKTTGTGTGATTSLATGVQQNLTGPADEVSLNALAQAKAKAEESRSWAEYVGGNVSYPEEWGLAENRYGAARDRSDVPETRADANARTAEWSAIGVLYDDIYKKDAPQFVEKLEEKLLDARYNALMAGAEELVPERFAQADEMVDSFQEKSENKDADGAIKTGKEAIERFLILQTLAEAHTRQVEADENDFFSIDPDTYMLAADAGNSAVDLYDEGALSESQAKANEAKNLFNQVLKNGWTPIVEETAVAAREWRTAAQGIKADVAVRSDFAAAEQAYNDAHVALRAEQYAEAHNLFEQSEELFIIAYDNASDKRDIADDALLQAEQKLAESEEKALNAEALLAGGE